ncbi:hypothetical protein RJ55_08024 [Drechmeria coniospora]|nr:hypothetical protein RJ55_08024 [Drechmeria coniospora]
MADFERTILEFYQLPTPYPVEWPAEKEGGEAYYSSGDEENGTKHRRRRSRYQALESAVHDRRSVVSGVEDIGNLVQQDEPDPLGTSDSVVQSLTSMGLPLQDDLRMRNRFLLSSTTFSPALFLSQMHANADTRSLHQGLDVLSQSIDQKSASLKVLVETNFERFVRAKATIDNVYKEMKFRGIDPNQPRGPRHVRHASRGSVLAGSVGSPLNRLSSDGRMKNALVKESDYGVMGIKTPLLDVSAKAEDVWGPALGGREMEGHLRTVSDQLDQFREYVELSASVSESINRNDYKALVESYHRARSFADEARVMSQQLRGESPADVQLYQMVIAGRMWHDVDQQIQAFKKDVWKKLILLPTLPKPENLEDPHMDIIGFLLELGVEGNPIWVWLLAKYDHIKSKIQTTADRSKVEIEVLRRRLANNDKPAPQTVAVHMRSIGRQPAGGKQLALDTVDIVELWEKMLAFITNLYSPQGVLGDLVEFWQAAQGFVDGKTQKQLPVGYNGESRVHHKLSQQVVSDLDKAIVELVELLRDHVFAFFADLPPEDVSLLFSPLPPMTPSSPTPPGGFTPTALRDPRFNFDPSNPPPQSPKRGEQWEKLAFWPPWSNSVSGVQYLSQMLALVGSAASEMASLRPVASGKPRLLDDLKSLVGVSRERCVTALCAAWNRDAENIKFVEDWQRSPEAGDVTRMPQIFSAFEGALLSGMQKILYIPDAMEKPGARNIVQPPSTKLLQMVRSQYVTTLYKALSGMVENAERSLKKDDDEWAAESPGAWQSLGAALQEAGNNTLDAGDRNIRMLLTLSNLQALRSQVVPSLNLQFENAFSVKLTDEAKTIRDVLGQIDSRLFQSFTKQSVDKVREIVQAGLTPSDWCPPPNDRPRSAKPYVYEALLTLVLVHSQLATTAPSLTPQVLSFLLEQTSLQLLDTFRLRPRYSLEALMQATLDVEFLAQTLSHYTTDRASELQSQIYQELDSRTDNDARARLQNELPEMRSMLKKLRDASKNEFACFKRPKRQAQTKTDAS